MFQGGPEETGRRRNEEQLREPRTLGSRRHEVVPRVCAVGLRAPEPASAARGGFPLVFTVER